MLVLFGILIIVASIILGLIILIQNPKGGGLSSSLGGFGNQLMGVKQTTDVLEKGTWLFAAIIGVLCLT
ncbi:MAG: preprotein translocase subunit SecG, partial [Ginsengibacter sp.]